MDLKVGDIVKLKNGGPKMTVEAHDPDGGVDCIWFVQRDDGNSWDGLFRDTFPAVLLEKADQ